MTLRYLVYSIYERRLTGKLAGKPVPRHVGVMCDGNRRWAREMGYVDPNDGHRVGAARIKELLGWCDQAGIEHVTLYLLATDNLQRPAAELDPLLQIIEDLATELAEDGNPWRLRIVGALDLLPAPTAAALKAAQERTRDRDRRRRGQHGGRLRRPARDRRRGPLAAARARESVPRGSNSAARLLVREMSPALPAA